MEKLLSSLSRFNRSEQTAILVGGLLLVLFLIWLIIVSPLNRKRDLLIQTTNANQLSLGKVKLLASQYEVLSRQSNQSGNGGDLSGLIDSSMRESGINMSSFTPGQGGEARVRVDKVSSEVLMQWLFDLESKYHVMIRELSITATNDVGQVSVNLRLAKP
ncbi:MAG: type II secretion system protein M [Gammaproteobacteria bacterium]|nr:MAG: type II secretion system protein M [Gammaproteobacteria bacterium]